MELQEKRMISGWLLVQSSGLCCCGSWKKRFCAVTATKTFQIRDSDKADSSVGYAQTFDNLIEAYHSFAGDVTGTFIAVFVDRVVRLRAETDYSASEWLKHLKPTKQRGHLEAQLKAAHSPDFMPIREFIGHNKEFWYSNVSQSERAAHIKDAASYTFELLDYIQCKKHAEACRVAFDAIAAKSKGKRADANAPVRSRDVVPEIVVDSASERAKPSSGPVPAAAAVPVSVPAKAQASAPAAKDEKAQEAKK